MFSEFGTDAARKAQDAFDWDFSDETVHWFCLRPTQAETGRERERQRDRGRDRAKDEDERDSGTKRQGESDRSIVSLKRHARKERERERDREGGGREGEGEKERKRTLEIVVQWDYLGARIRPLEEFEFEIDRRGDPLIRVDVRRVHVIGGSTVFGAFYINGCMFVLCEKIAHTHIHTYMHTTHTRVRAHKHTHAPTHAHVQACTQ